LEGIIALGLRVSARFTLEIHFLFFTPQGGAEKSKNEFREGTFPLVGVVTVPAVIPDPDKNIKHSYHPDYRLF
jgi:hypothetical protein